MISPHFVCLSMCVNSRAWDESPTFSAMDYLALVLAKEGDGPVELPPLLSFLAPKEEA